MKPKTKIQKEVARLSANLRPISATQIDWAYRHCVEHIGHPTKKEEHHLFRLRSRVAQRQRTMRHPLKAAPAPKCHAELKVQDTRRRIYKGNAEFQRDNHLQRVSGNPRGAGQMREQERRTDAFLLPRGRAALDFTRRQGYGHGVAPWLPFLLLRCVGIRQRYGGKTAQQPIR